MEVKPSLKYHLMHQFVTMYSDDNFHSDHPDPTVHGSASQCCSSVASKVVYANLFWLFV